MWIKEPMPGHPYLMCKYATKKFNAFADLKHAINLSWLKTGIQNKENFLNL